MFEIYNERIGDLVEPWNKIEMFDLGCGSTALEGLTDRPVANLGQFERVLSIGYDNRHQGPRSRHTIVRVTVRMPEQTGVEGWHSELHLVSDSIQLSMQQHPAQYLSNSIQLSMQQHPAQYATASSSVSPASPWGLLSATALNTGGPQYTMPPRADRSMSGRFVWRKTPKRSESQECRRGQLLPNDPGPCDITTC